MVITRQFKGLTTATRAILSVVQLDATLSIKEIAKRTKLSIPAVQYQLRKMSDAGLIRRGALINHFDIGLQLWQVYLTLGSAAFKKREALFTYLRKCDHVLWLAELGGDFHFGLFIASKTPQEVSNFLAQVSEKFSSPFIAKNISLALSYAAIRKKIFSPEKRTSPLDAVLVSPTLVPVKIDKVDAQILATLSDSSLNSHPQMAQKLGIPRTTFEYRLSNLEKTGVVKQHIYYINSRLLGHLSYKFLVKTVNVSRRSSELIFNFALNDLNTVYFVECLGSNDFELSIEVAQALDVMQVLERLHLACEPILERVTVVPVFQQVTSSSYMSAAATPQ